ncbi:hypothetical protein ACFQI3_11650 [Hansschlegelia quercus]|uniref:Uncharacterized protein n=1 Tax=Hansschlegelia quercus TaxID=2528245 RepID=A0A4Q9GKC0_9HYPH|nr:hypothetical protein [Hansschlegelia quercus]TBN53485.1 hypothetical protein EYR15_10785 [Hansschlegelia quercus]
MPFFVFTARIRSKIVDLGVVAPEIRGNNLFGVPDLFTQTTPPSRRDAADRALITELQRDGHGIVIDLEPLGSLGETVWSRVTVLFEATSNRPEDV